MNATLPGQRVGYVRVSSPDQNPDRQIAALGRVDRLFVDTTSGATRAGRHALEDLLAWVRDGDTVVVASMDRLARSLRDLHDVVDEITAAGAVVEFVRESQTYRPGGTDPMSDLMLGVLGAVAEFERSLIRERQAQGIARARARGVYKGRRPSLDPERLAHARARIAQGVPKAVVARDLGVHRSTLHRALNAPSPAAAAHR